MHVCARDTGVQGSQRHWIPLEHRQLLSIQNFAFDNIFVNFLETV